MRGAPLNRRGGSVRRRRGKRRLLSDGEPKRGGEKALEELEKAEIREFARQASIQEGEGYADRELGYATSDPSNRGLSR